MNNDEIYAYIKQIGINIFKPDTLDSYITFIKLYNPSIKYYFVGVTQIENEIRLEFSVLSDKIISEYTLRRNSFEVCIIPVEKITFFKTELLGQHRLILRLITSTQQFLTYQTFKEKDTELLFNYSKAIANRLNL